MPLAWETGQRPWQRACPKPVPTKLCSGAACYVASDSLKESAREKPNPELTAPMAAQAGVAQLVGKDSPLSAGAFSPGEGNSLPFSSADLRQQPKCSAFISSLQVLSVVDTASLPGQACFKKPSFVLLVIYGKPAAPKLPSVRK